MKNNTPIKLVMLLLAIVVLSCNNPGDPNDGNPGNLQECLIYPKGEKIENDHFNGTAWLTSEEYSASK